MYFIKENHLYWGHFMKSVKKIKQLGSSVLCYSYIVHLDQFHVKTHTFCLFYKVLRAHLLAFGTPAAEILACVPLDLVEMYPPLQQLDCWMDAIRRMGKFRGSLNFLSSINHPTCSFITTKFCYLASYCSYSQLLLSEPKINL